jgi:toxin secretion/phage lysis holin
MAIDYISGLAVAGIFKKSKKSANGAISSKCSLQGLFKKGMQLLIVLVAYRIDIMAGMEFVRMGVIIAFVSNELISIIENAGLMGIPVPDKLCKAIEMLNVNGQSQNRS